MAWDGAGALPRNDRVRRTKSMQLCFALDHSSEALCNIDSRIHTSVAVLVFVSVAS